MSSAEKLKILQAGLQDQLKTVSHTLSNAEAHVDQAGSFLAAQVRRCREHFLVNSVVLILSHHAVCCFPPRYALLRGEQSLCQI